MNASFTPGVRPLLAAALALTLASSSAIARSHFTAVRAQIDLFEVPNVVVIASQLDPSFAEVGSLPDIYAKARASYGNNGAFATATGKPTTLGAYAESIWADDFTVLGSSGTGTLDIRVVVNGSMDGGGVPGGPGSNSLYQLFVSSSPISCDFDAMSCTGTRLMFAEGIAGSRSFDAQISFTYGETFYVASYLGAEVLGDGFSDFYHSAHFGATVTGNVALTGGSGFTYASVSSVPEPAQGVLLLAGLASVAVFGRSHARHARRQ